MCRKSCLEIYQEVAAPPGKPFTADNKCTAERMCTTGLDEQHVVTRIGHPNKMLRGERFRDEPVMAMHSL